MIHQTLSIEIKSTGKVSSHLKIVSDGFFFSPANFLSRNKFVEVFINEYIIRSDEGN